MKMEICIHCGGDIALRNPKGYCDHLYYPDNCKECQRLLGVDTFSYYWKRLNSDKKQMLDEEFKRREDKYKQKVKGTIIKLLEVEFNEKIIGEVVGKMGDAKLMALMILDKLRLDEND